MIAISDDWRQVHISSTYSTTRSQIANGDPESSVNDGSPVSLVGPTLNRYRIAMRPYIIVWVRIISGGIRSDAQVIPSRRHIIHVG